MGHLNFDIAIIGSGFGGSMMAMVARRLGRSVVLLERGKHPRFAIGESTSPLMNLLIEELARRYDLPRLLPLTTYGQWQRTYPEVVCGLKRGFTYYFHEAGKPFHADPSRSNQLLVAASPSDEVSDVHWLRSSVDQFLANEAASVGTELLEETQVLTAKSDTSGWTLGCAQNGESFQISARLLIDATGPRGFLARTFGLAESVFPGYPATQTLYSHFTGVLRTDEMEAYAIPGDPPYHPDDAALHHVFDGGWMWVLRLNNGVTSAGFAVEGSFANELEISEREPAWERFLKRFPTIGEQFKHAEPIIPFVYSSALAYRCSVAAGENWLILPSAAAFIDPLFSTGMPLTLLGIERAGQILAQSWGNPDLPDQLRNYGETTLAEADWTARFIGASYAAFPRFPLFAALSMFYFAAASFSEMARRLDRRELIRRFLAADHPAFSSGLKNCTKLILETRKPSTIVHLPSPNEFSDLVATLIEPLNIAGLADPEKRNWYPVDLDDVVRGTEKLGYTAEQIRDIIAVAPWAKF